MKKALKKVTTPSNALQKAFDSGLEQIIFRINETTYLFVAEYDEKPQVKGRLFIADDDDWMRLIVDDAGEPYYWMFLPETWKGLPDALAWNIALATYILFIDDFMEKLKGKADQDNWSETYQYQNRR
jgi:hypothetical protein